MDADARAKKFFFVNKSGGSTHLSRSSSTEITDIQRHVQTGRKRARDHKSKKAKTTEHQSKFQSVDSSATSKVDASSHGPHSNDPVPDQPCELQPLARPERNAEESLISHSISVHDTSLARTAPLSLQTLLCNRDPFDASSVPINKPVAGLLHYYINYYHPSQWPNEMALLRKGVYIFEDAVMKVMKSAIADQMTMFCLLSAAACRLQFVDRLPCPLINGVERRLIPQALRMMALQLESDFNREANHMMRLLTCMMFLSSAEAYRGELTASRMHFIAATRLLEQTGGIASVHNESLRGQLSMSDLFLASVNLEPCLLDCVYDPGPASLLELRDHELHEHETKAEASSLLGRQSSSLSQLQTAIEELVESHSVKCRVIASSMNPARAKQVLHWITLRNMAIRHKLLALESLDSKSHALRIALIMWTLLAMNVTGRAKTVKIMAPKLKESLLNTTLSDWLGSADIKLWVVLVGAYCANNDSLESTWFVNECCILIPCRIPLFAVAPSIAESAERLAIFQRNFFYDAQAQEVTTKSLAERFLRVLA